MTGTNLAKSHTRKIRRIKPNESFLCPFTFQGNVAIKNQGSCIYETKSMVRGTGTVIGRISFKRIQPPILSHLHSIRTIFIDEICIHENF